jgi:hypothetical protein
LRVLDIELPTGRERLAGTAISRWQNAVKHVDAACDSLDKIFRGTDAHQIAGLFRWHQGRDLLNHVKHDRFLLADA